MSDERDIYRSEVLDLQSLKGECEEKIHAILNDFTEKTGLSVEGISLTTYEIHGMRGVKYIPKLDIKL